MPLGLLLLIIFFGLLGTTVGIAWLSAGWRKMRGVRKPVNDRMLRPVGASLDEQANGLSERMLMWYLMAVLVPLVAATTIALGGSLKAPVPAPKAWSAVSLAVLCFIPPAIRFFVIARRYRACARHSCNLASQNQMDASDCFRSGAEVPGFGVLTRQRVLGRYLQPAHVTTFGKRSCDVSQEKPPPAARHHREFAKTLPHTHRSFRRQCAEKARS